MPGTLSALETQRRSLLHQISQWGVFDSARLPLLGGVVGTLTVTGRGSRGKAPPSALPPKWEAR
jgi:hypothetical protein